MTVRPPIFWGQFWDKGGVVGWVPRGPHHLLPANDWVCPWHTVNSATTKLRLLTCFDHTLRERLSLAVHKPTHPAISRFTPVKISQQSLLGLGSSKLLIQLVSYFPGCLYLDHPVWWDPNLPAVLNKSTFMSLPLCDNFRLQLQTSPAKRV